jgi:hypothetical protein
VPSNLHSSSNDFTIPLNFNAYHSPLRQAQEQILLWALREARNPEPADTSVAVLIFRASADTNGVFDNIATGRGRVDCRGVRESADKLHLRKRSGSGGGECASAGARESGAEGEHCESCVWRLKIDVFGVVEVGQRYKRCAMGMAYSYSRAVQTR